MTNINKKFSELMAEKKVLRTLQNKIYDVLESAIDKIDAELDSLIEEMWKEEE